MAAVETKGYAKRNSQKRIENARPPVDPGNLN